MEITKLNKQKELLIYLDLLLKVPITYGNSLHKDRLLLSDWLELLNDFKDYKMFNPSTMSKIASNHYADILMVHLGLGYSESIYISSLHIINVLESTGPHYDRQ